MKINIGILKNALKNLIKLVRYNLKIVFMNRFVWFVLASFAFFVFIVFMQLYNNEIADESFIYDALIFPGILLLFYPTVFGIQADKDARILEILFGIPDYRYKVWLVRLCLVFLLVFIFVEALATISYLGVVRFSIIEMGLQLMLPLGFFGCFAFMISTLVKSGYGTAVIIIILGVMLLILADPLEHSMWNVFLNPFRIPDNLNEIVWQNITLKNRIFIGSSIIVFLLYGLFNLQKREQFIG